VAALLKHQVYIPAQKAAEKQPGTFVLDVVAVHAVGLVDQRRAGVVGLQVGSALLVQDLQLGLAPLQLQLQPLLVLVLLVQQRVQVVHLLLVLLHHVAVLALLLHNIR